MSDKITGKEYPLMDIFSKNFEYFIPAYQRPYAWTEEETGALFDDLYEFYSSEQEDNYFLGSIVLIKEDNKPHSDVIDGQQRLTTLTILMAVIASYFDGKQRIDCMEYIIERGNSMAGIKSFPRLHLRQKDQPFFNKYIQNVNIDELIKLDSENLQNESQIHIKENCELLKGRFDNKFKKDVKNILKFCNFLLQRCFLVVVYTPSQESAFRVFSVMNSRGLNLMPIDIIKSDVIGKIDKSKQQKYTDKWEELEIKVTRAGFNDVFTHTRMIYAKSRPKKTLLEEFRTFVMDNTKPEELIDDILKPYSDAYSILKERKYASVKNAEEINDYLFWLNRIDNSDWMPSAIKFFADRSDQPDYILWFVKKLERLASYMHITAKDVYDRVDRYKLLLEEMEGNPDHCIDDPLLSIELSNTEKNEFMHALDGEIYKMTGKRRNYVILRLNDFVSDGAAKFDSGYSILTIEHVMPQSINEDSEWAEWWPEIDNRKVWLNRIANLVPLTRRKNSEAQNFDFERKKKTYFKSKNGTTSYPLTTQVLNEDKWTPEVVEKRQQYLLKIFREKWDLYVNDMAADSNEEENTAFFIKNRRQADAVGYSAENGFVVQENSKISPDVVEKFAANYPNAFKLRKSLIEDGTIVNSVFQTDYEFESISLAASVVLGRNASGQREWTDNTGKSYGELSQNSFDLSTFNIADETTYKMLKPSQLAYELFKKIFELENISDEEIELFKTIEYSKQIFSRTDYPVFADSRDANRGRSNVIRYRKDPIMFKGKEIYFTNRWFEGNRNDIVSWYKKHL